MDVEVLKWIKYLSLFLYYKISNEIHENQLQRSDNLKDRFNCFKRRWMMTYGMAMASGGRSQSHCGEKMTLFTVAFCQCIKLHPWYSSSVSKQWPINLFFIFKKWTKLQRAKSDEWSRWWAKILLVWAKKKKNILCFQLALSQHEMSFWQALQFRSFLLNALPQDITVKFDTGIPTLGDEFMVHSLMKTKGKKENKQAYSWSHYSPDVLNLGLEIDPSHKIWASLKQNRMFDFQDKIAHHIAYVVVTVFPKAWYRNAGGCLHMPENMIFNVNFSQVSVLIIMDLFFTLCTQLWP